MVGVQGFPMRLLVYHTGVDAGMCFQFWIPIGVWLVLMAYRISLSLVAMLRDPFKITEGSACDVFNLDGLMSSTEQTVFCSLRSQFDNTARLHGRYGSNNRRNGEPPKFKPRNLEEHTRPRQHAAVPHDRDTVGKQDQTRSARHSSDRVEFSSILRANTEAEAVFTPLGWNHSFEVPHDRDTVGKQDQTRSARHSSDRVEFSSILRANTEAEAVFTPLGWNHSLEDTLTVTEPDGAGDAATLASVAHFPAEDHNPERTRREGVTDRAVATGDFVGPNHNPNPNSSVSIDGEGVGDAAKLHTWRTDLPALKFAVPHQTSPVHPARSSKVDVMSSDSVEGPLSLPPRMSTDSETLVCKEMRQSSQCIQLADVAARREPGTVSLFALAG